MKKKVLLRSDKIEQYLIEKNRSQSWLASRIGISRGYMSQLISRQRCASPELRQNMMKTLSISDFDEIFEIK